jgi:NAD(P)-dependent dehydrogenase (short-subunit alcohol dehydrogenase family)
LREIEDEFPEHAMGFEGRAALVTGAAGGMGRRIALDLLAAGTDVTLIDVRDEPLPGDAGPGRARTATGSVADWDFVRTAVAGAHEAFGRLDYLVNAAGVLWFDRDRSLVDIDLAVWDEVMAINLKGAVHAVRAAVPLMRASGGAMVHFSTIQALRGDSRPQDAYQASKAGLIALSKSIAIQYAGDRIRSNCVLPGPTASPMQARWRAEPALEAATARAVPLGRVGTVEDMSAACLFLLSDRAGFITGTELVVDGGITALP